MHYKDLPDLLENRVVNPFIIILDGIEDPHNFGAILRTAEVVGATGVVIRKARQVQITETVAKVSTGAVDIVPVARVPNISEAIRYLKDQGVKVYGIEADGQKQYTQADFTGPVGIVLGSEGEGISRLVKERCDEIVKIPMYGKISSLNVSVACGVVCYEVLRQRHLSF